MRMYADIGGIRWSYAEEAPQQGGYLSAVSRGPGTVFFLEIAVENGIRSGAVQTGYQKKKKKKGIAAWFAAIAYIR